jgi:hypothetical protein
MARFGVTRRLRMEPAAAFVDFEHYEATGEPSAFFVQPIEVDGAPAGSSCSARSTG